MTVAFILLIIFAVILVIVSIRYIFVRKNINELKKECEQLREETQKALEASEAKSIFLSNMSHDIRTPINGIMGMTEMALKEKNNSNKTTDCLKKIDDAGKHLLALVNDVLDMSRIESGVVQMIDEPMNLRKVVKECESIAVSQLVGHGIEFVGDYEGITVNNVLGDEFNIRKILINVLTHSIKFTRPGGRIFFSVSDYPLDDERVLLYVEVEDTGIGMKEDHINEVWEAFSKEEENPLVTSYDGCGLSLTITKHLLDLMDGSISVSSTYGEGSKFIIKLPMRISETDKKELNEDAERDISGMRIMVVEDVELNLEVAKDILESRGALVDTAVNGKEAVDLFYNSDINAYKMIFMDIMMPVMDGLTAAREIRNMEREDASSVPIVAMTANAFDEDVRATYEAGMNAHLCKPLSVANMIEVIEKYVI